MSDRFLETLAHAARSETEAQPADVTRTRAALLARAQSRVRLRGGASTAVALLSVAAIAGTALGAPLNRERVIGFWRALVDPGAEVDAGARSVESRSAVRVAPRATSGPVVGERDPPKRLEPVPPPAPAATDDAARRERPARRAAPLVDPLYVEAHRAHFETEDAANALRLWDRYLEQSRHPEFVPEARYNRAICLVRLRRTREAREALEPFAEGELGAYRQREALVLLERLTSQEHER